MPVAIPRERIVSLFEKAGGRPLKAKDVGKSLGMHADDRSEVRDLLRELADDGVLVQLEGKRYVLAGASNAHKGVVQRKASGSGWFIPDDKRVGDAFLPPHELLGVVDGDRVLVTITREKKGPAAKLVRVLERRRTTLTGVLKDSGKAKWVEADDNVLSGPIVIPPGAEGNADAAREGDVVEVLIVEHPTPVTTAVGRIVRSLGKRGKLDVEIERILAEKNIIKAFPPEVAHESEQFGSEPREEDVHGRENLRTTPLVTIDGETAKDFDDAVFAEFTRDGKKGDVHVIVAIADVSHYVTHGSALDVEAARRGTSIYYPGRVIPMLPEALSNGLCSLKPHVDRLCMVAEFDVRKDGSMTSFQFYEAVMNSHARLTYTKVQKFFDGDNEIATELSEPVKQSLRALDEASQRLRKARQRRGALDFDLPETVVALDDKGEPVQIHALERLNAHKLIEDLMVAANEAVAQHFEKREWPCIYRIHEPPDPEKLERWKKLAQLLAGKKLNALQKEPVSPSALMEVMTELADVPGKRALDSLLLRSMMQAKYSAHNVGHYGLGSESYLHFTSPIRRYPDLVVHRLLRDRLRGAGKKKKRNQDADDALLALLDDISSQSSQCERTATEIERAIDALHAAWFMKDRIGETFDGLVQGVAEFGLFMLLEGANVEGMVRVSDLGDDYYAFDEIRLRLVGERSGRTFSIGDKLKVKIAGVDVARRQIGLVLDEEVERPRRHRGDERRGGRFARDDDGGSRDSRGGQREQREPREQRGDQRGERGGRTQRGRGAARGQQRRGAGGGVREQARELKEQRPTIRGPEDLRRIFEEKASKGGDRGERSEGGREGGRGRGPRGGGKGGGRSGGKKRR